MSLMQTRSQTIFIMLHEIGNSRNLCCISLVLYNISIRKYAKCVCVWKATVTEVDKSVGETFTDILLLVDSHLPQPHILLLLFTHNEFWLFSKRTTGLSWSWLLTLPTKFNPDQIPMSGIHLHFYLLYGWKRPTLPLPQPADHPPKETKQGKKK